jgi:hypothetical protein
MPTIRDAEEARDALIEKIKKAHVRHFSNVNDSGGAYMLMVGHHTVWIGEDGEIK